MQKASLTRRQKAVTVAIVILIAIGTPLVAGADGTDPKVFGQTYGEWSGDWWSWVLQFPSAINPLFSEGDVDCTLGQSGKVWFLAGNFGGENDRSCDIPHGKALFLPIMNVVLLPETGDTEEELRESAKLNVDGADVVDCTVDGTPCIYTQLLVRTQSPAFNIEVTADSLLAEFGFDLGDLFPSIADGWWVMLPPLTPGAHDVRLHGHNAGFEVDVTYHLFVE
jgi:hypothetical protein